MTKITASAGVSGSPHSTNVTLAELSGEKLAVQHAYNTPDQGYIARCL